MPRTEPTSDDGRSPPREAPKTLVSGSTGLIGRALVPRLERAGHDVTRLVRPGSRTADGIRWAPSRGEIDRTRLEGFDAVVHLAGEPVDQRWTGRAKRRIRESRVRGTRLLAEALADLDDPPAVLVSASAVGYYGDCGDEWLAEDAPPGDLFISEVCRRWEAAARAAAESGIRVVTPRIGVVLSADGGALRRMLPAFELGVGGHVGSGEQYVPWITREDAVRALEHLVDADGVEGPVNVCAPEPVTNETLTAALGDALGKPTALRLPAVAVRLALGRMGEEVLLAGQRTRPAELEASGFAWRHPELRPALERALAD